MRKIIILNGISFAHKRSLDWTNNCALQVVTNHKVLIIHVAPHPTIIMSFVFTKEAILSTTQLRAEAVLANSVEP